MLVEVLSSEELIKRKKMNWKRMDIFTVERQS